MTDGRDDTRQTKLRHLRHLLRALAEIEEVLKNPTAHSLHALHYATRMQDAIQRRIKEAHDTTIADDGGDGILLKEKALRRTNGR